MITYIIPTLWKSERIFDIIGSVQTSEYGVKLIIIDNDNSSYDSNHSNITVLKPGKNIFVNPAWNLGVHYATTEYVCLLNDDIYFNLDLFNKAFIEQVINTGLSKDLGIISFKSGSNFSDSINANDDHIQLVESDMLGSGFGQLMLFKKNLYEPIPDVFKIYFGDNYLYFLFHNLLKKKVMHYEGLKFIGELSATSKDYEEDYLQKEFKFWKQSTEELYNKYNT